MKKNFTALKKGVFWGTLSFGVISAILRTLSMLFFFDSGMGYYEIGAILPIISNLFLGIGIIGVIALAIALFGKKSMALDCGRVGPFQITGCVVGVLATLFLAVSSIPAAIGGDKLSALFSALAFTGALYFPCTCLRLGNVWRIITGIALVARITCMMGVYYFNQDITMNAPDKVIFCIACIFAMWIIPCSLKAIMGVVRPWIFITAASCATTICATASLPSIIKLHADNTFIGGGYAEYWFLFAVAIYALTMLSGYAIKAREEIEAYCEASGEGQAPQSDENYLEDSDEGVEK